MIARGTPIQIRRSGTSVPVERLEIGDLLYDPVADNYIEILDILSRENARLGLALTRLPAGRFGLGLPRQDLLISRQQPIGYPERSEPSGPAHLEFAAACKLGEEHRVSTVLFALFCERPGCISARGVTLRVFDPSSLGPSAGTRTGQPIAGSTLRKPPSAAVAPRRSTE